MRFSDIVNVTKRYFSFGVAAVILLAAMFCVGYFLIYKKWMRGTRSLTGRTVLLAAISACYLAVVLGAVFLNRGNDYHRYILQPFYSYVEAWNGWSAVGWRNIILNILLFVPFGFLLPLWSERLWKVWRVVLGGFAFSLIIELVQLITSVGIFETDDLMGNTFGVLIGYGFGMQFLSLIHREKLSAGKMIGYITPFVILLAAVGGIFAAYSLKELGNLGCTYSLRVNMKDVSLSSETQFSKETGSADIYYTSIGRRQDAKELAEAIFACKGTALDETQTDLYDESALYYAKGRSMSVWFTYLGNTYRYNDFSQFNDDIKRITGADEATIRKALADLNITLPKACTFENSDTGSYILTADMAESGDMVMDGTLLCEYYSDGTIKKAVNNIVECSLYRACDIISEAEAYEQVKTGKFISHYFFDAPYSIEIKNVELDNVLDSKGYYQPVYRFNCVYTDASKVYNSTILIPAMK